MAGHAFELSYKVLATSQRQAISLKHGVLEIHESLPCHIQSEIESIYIESTTDDRTVQTREYIRDLNFLQKMFTNPHMKYAPTEYEPEHVSGEKSKILERERYQYANIGLMCQYMRFIKRVVEIAEREIIITLSDRS